MDVAVVIPSYNEENTLGMVIAKMEPEWDVIVVDDGSKDDTVGVAQGVGALVLRHDCNLGYDAALETGLNYARNAGYRMAVTIDADGQIPVEIIKDAVKRVDEGADLVLGRRRQQARWAERIYSGYARYRYGVRDILCGLKAYRLACFEGLPRFSMNCSIGTAVALVGLRMGLHWVEVDVPVRHRIDTSRFGSGFRANWKILKGGWREVLVDLRSSKIANLR
ncbi:MAG: glycosyltransferase family 2 protein [Nitrospirales bacterium]